MRTPSAEVPDVMFPGSDFTPAELEFIQAMERYQKTHRRRFPSFREILQVLLSLGYRKTQTEDSQAA